MQSFGMNLESQSSLELLRMQPTEIVLQSFLDSIGGLNIHEFSYFCRIQMVLIFSFVSLSTKSGDKLASLDQYISRMKPNQKDIYYITGSSKEQLEKSPFLEQLKKKGYEV